MEIRYQLFEKDNLLIQKFIGIFSIEDYLSYNSQVREKLSLSPVKKVLNDFRDLLFGENNEKFPVGFREKIDKMVEIRKNINQQEHINEEVKLVIWVEHPLPTAFALLFTNSFAGMDYSYCLTGERAADFLDIPSYRDNLENIIENLENLFIKHDTPRL
jgi:hypothetical protein